MGNYALTVASLRANFHYMSDDMVFLVDRTDGFRVLAFPEAVDVSDETAAFFLRVEFFVALSQTSRLEETADSPDTSLWHEAGPEARPAAVVIPRISEAQTSVVTRMDPDEALLELIPNALLTEEVACRADLDALSRLVKSTPCYRLETGRDFDRLPVQFRELLDS